MSWAAINHPLTTFSTTNDNSSEQYWAQKFLTSPSLGQQVMHHANDHDVNKRCTMQQMPIRISMHIKIRINLKPFQIAMWKSLESQTHKTIQTHKPHIHITQVKRTRPTVIYTSCIWTYMHAKDIHTYIPVAILLNILCTKEGFNWWTLVTTIFFNRCKRVFTCLLVIITRNKE